MRCRNSDQGGTGIADGVGGNGGAGGGEETKQPICKHSTVAANKGTKPVKPSEALEQLIEGYVDNDVHPFMEYSDRDVLRAAVFVAESIGVAKEKIAAERKRQINEEGYDSDHDDCYDSSCLAVAAASYALLSASQNILESPHWLLEYAKQATRLWPFDDEFWKPSQDPIRNLEKAGALIAAEIDRLTRAKTQESLDS